MKRMSNRRHVEICELLDNCESKARICRNGAINLARIRNQKGADYQNKKAERLERIVKRCQHRLFPAEYPPICSNNCRYRQKYTGFALQTNALRCELASMIQIWRCGWYLKPGHLGGEPLDYEPCISQ